MIKAKYTHKNTLFFVNKRFFLSLFSAINQCIFVLSTEIKRERPKQPDKMSTKQFHHAVSSQLATLLLMFFLLGGAKVG
ncbi:MAG: hypothetical protein ACK4TA_07155, partial [Saprospiraceae bacterium]